MLGSFSDFLNSLSDGCFDFSELWKWVSDLYYDITKTSDIKAIWDALMEFLEPMYFLVVLLTLAFCLSLSFFGQRLMPVLKFIALFVVGFVLGVYYFPPALDGLIEIPDWLCGLLLALVVSVLYRILYAGFVTLAVAYCTYTVCYSGFFIAQGGDEKVSIPLVIFSTVIAILSVIISFYFLKYIEMVATAIIGAYLFSFYLRIFIFNYKALPAFESDPWVAAFIITLVIALPAFFVQFKLRKNY